jgi:tetratricopeptide (TPR) repeat protein
MCRFRDCEGTAAGYGVADIFISYTSADSDWAKWLAKELESLGHTPHVHEWEIAGGGDIAAWMEERHHNADHILCVVSEAYLTAPYSSWERRTAQWAAATTRPNFALPVFIESCEPPTLLASVKRCDLYGLSEAEARAQFAAFLTPAARPSGPMAFPGAKKVKKIGRKPSVSPPVAFPGKASAISNIPIRVPLHFFGRDEDLAAINAALKRNQSRVAITALHGLRGVGKTTLAAAYAEQHRGDYRATWWVRAETESTMRADLVGLGVQLGWIAPDASEEHAVAAVLDQLRREGEGVLLIYDNATSPNELGKFLPRGIGPHLVVTSNAPNWGGVAVPVEIEVWPNNIGADFLTERTGRIAEREAALTLSDALGGLPLAHEQAAAYCERVGVALAEYTKRFETTPAIVLDDQQDASREYHDGLTVAKTFALAINEASQLHPAAELLIVYAALLAPEPIPLYLFSEARETFGEPLASSLKDGGLDEAVAALRAFALVDREKIPDERDPSIVTDCIRLHRLVRQVAATRCEGETLKAACGMLVEALQAVFPDNVYNDPKTWPRVRRLDALVVALVDGRLPLVEHSTKLSNLLRGLALYKMGPLAAYHHARPLLERALLIDEKTEGPDHPHFASALGLIGFLLQAQGDLLGARPYFERALAIRERVLGPDHPDTARSLNNLGGVLRGQGDLARPYFERALAITEKALGPDHPHVGACLNNLGSLLDEQGNFAGARPYYERSLKIREKALGLDHPDTALALHNLGSLLYAQGDPARARPYCEQSLVTFEKTLGIMHPSTQKVARQVVAILGALDLDREAAEFRKKYGINGQGNEHQA